MDMITGYIKVGIIEIKNNKRYDNFEDNKDRLKMLNLGSMTLQSMLTPLTYKKFRIS